MRSKLFSLLALLAYSAIAEQINIESRVLRLDTNSKAMHYEGQVNVYYNDIIINADQLIITRPPRPGRQPESKLLFKNVTITRASAQGTGPTLTVKGRKATFVGGSKLTVSGGVRVITDNNTLLAEKIFYDTEKGVLGATQVGKSRVKAIITMSNE